MKKIIFLIVVGSLLSFPEVFSQKESPTVNQLVIVANNPGPVISKDIYGQFSEHLGGCIYGGIWVGRDSKIPNTDGIRNDVIAALKEMKAWRMLCRYISLEGWNRSSE